MNRTKRLSPALYSFNSQYLSNVAFTTLQQPFDSL